MFDKISRMVLPFAFHFILVFVLLSWFLRWFGSFCEQIAKRGKGNDNSRSCNRKMKNSLRVEVRILSIFPTLFSCLPLSVQYRTKVCRSARAESAWSSRR